MVFVSIYVSSDFDGAAVVDSSHLPWAPQMRALRISVLVLCVLAAALLAALIFIGSSTERTVGIAKALFAWATPYELELRDPSIEWSPFRFQTALLLIKYPDPTAPPVVSMQNLSLDVPLDQLFSESPSVGTFAAQNVSYFIDNQSSDEPINIEELLFPLELLPAAMDIDSVHFMSRNESVWIFPLSQVRGDRREDGALNTSARTEVSGRPVVFEAVGRWRTLSDGHHRLELDATMASDTRDSLLTLKGRLNAVDEALDYRFSLHGEYAEVSDFVQAFDERAYPFSGNLQVDGTLEGDLQQFTLSLDELALKTPGDYEFVAKGSVSQTSAGPVLLALTARGEANDVQGLLPFPPAALSKLTRSELQLDVAGTLEAPQISAARVVLFGAGETRVRLALDETKLNIADLDKFELDENEALQFEIASADLAGLFPEEFPAEVQGPVSFAADGTFKGSMEDLRATFSKLTLENADYLLSAKGKAQWHLNTLSAPELSAQLQEKSDAGRLNVEGTIADLQTLRGLALRTEWSDVSPEQIASALGIERPPPAIGALSGEMLLLKAADPWLAREITVEAMLADALQVRLNGSASYSDLPEADIGWSIEVTDRKAWTNFTRVAPLLQSYNGTLRLRKNYATALGELQVGDTDVQTVLGADLNAGAITELSIDLYSPHLHIPDLLFAKPQEPPATSLDTADKGTDGDDGIDVAALKAKLPAFPIHTSFRSDVVTGPLSRLEQLSVSVDGNQQRFILSHFDTRYAGGELMLRGLLDFSQTPIVSSLAGQGIRVPLAALTQDLGVQQSVRGELSVRGGLSGKGSSIAEVLASLDGRIATAANDLTVSGAAYDLLMSNLLAWLVVGVNDKTTTFNCAMAQFDVKAGLAKSDSLYLETRRMLATGKSTIDLAASTLDLRLEPRSKTRTVQFPSDVKMSGPLSSPSIRVSALQTTADMSAQALMLLPNLTLKLFGLAPDRSSLQPCVAALN
ncbi:MAG: hypothetical protein Cons2KO_16320 [Congregibacter sp.]